MKKLLLSFLIFVPIIVFGQIINVPGDYATIQEGIDAANTGDIVLVQPGTYQEHLQWEGKQITLASLYLTSLDSNHILQTIIDGDSTGCPLFIAGVGPGSNLVGFTICNGFLEKGSGGGIGMLGGSISIDHVILKNNISPEGGGMFSGNADVILSYCAFEDNVAIDKGGGFNALNCSLEIENCLFENNNAALGGAAYLSVNGNFPFISPINISSCIVTNNTSEFQTPGIYVRRNGTNTIIDLQISGCDFTNNHGMANGALQIRGDSLSFYVENCKFLYNTVQDYTAAVSLLQGCSGELYNCLFASNSAALGGGNWNGGGLGTWAFVEAYLNNCTFVDNTASYGAGLTVGPECVVFAENSIFWGNANQQIAIVDYEDMGGTLAIDYCDMEYGFDSIRVDPNSQMFWGDHNIAGDPLFAVSGEEPYEITAGSPCIDGGSPDITGTDLPPYDILGNIRIWDGDENGSEIIDMGAYEFGAPIWVGIPDNPLTSATKRIIEKVYPNPGNQSIKIDYRLENNASLHIYTITGKSVLESTIVADREGVREIDIGHLAPGLYFIRIVNEQKSDVAKILIK